MHVWHRCSCSRRAKLKPIGPAICNRGVQGMLGHAGVRIRPNPNPRGLAAKHFFVCAASIR